MQVPREQEAQFIPFLAQLEADKLSLGVTDVHLSLTSLVRGVVLFLIVRRA